MQQNAFHYVLVNVINNNYTLYKESSRECFVLKLVGYLIYRYQYKCKKRQLNWYTRALADQVEYGSIKPIETRLLIALWVTTDCNRTVNRRFQISVPF